MGGPGRADGRLGWRATCGARIPRGAGAGRDDERVWNVQCAGDELFTPAAGDGTGPDAPRIPRKAASQNKGAVGRDSDLRGGLGLVPGPGLRAAGDAGNTTLRRG